MLNAITKIAKIENLLAKMTTSRFNAILPLNIDVKEKIDPTRYLLQIGKREISTKSLIDLEVGAKYWGILKENTKTNSINLSNLLKKPKILNLQNQINFPSFDQQSLLTLFSKTDPKNSLKTMIIQNLSNATSKSEFIILSNMLLALHENIFSFILNEKNKSTLFQLRKNNKQKSNSKNSTNLELEFYAAFEHLGPINGTIQLIQNETKLTLNLYYENSAIFLKKELSSLDMIATININKNITPLFEFGNSLLDLKG